MVDEAFGTSRPGVFAAGDAVSGPATIVQAVAQGNLVAAADGSLVRDRQDGEAASSLTLRHDVAEVAHNSTTTPTARRR